jgi:putative ABC transport system permease protein
MSLLSLSFEALKERRLRSTLTILMVVMGGGLLVAVNGLSNGTVWYVNHQFANLGANLLVVTPRGEDVKFNDRLTNEFLKIEGVNEVTPFIQQVSTLNCKGREQKAIIVMGMDQSKLTLIFPTLEIGEGNIVSPSDKIGVILGDRVVYSSSDVPPFANLGETLKVKYSTVIDGKPKTLEKSFSVKGIIAYLGSGLVPVDQMAFTSLSAANSLFERNGEYDGIYVITNSPELNDAVRRDILAKYNVNILSPKAIADTIQKITVAISLFVGNIAAVSLLVASVGIITTLWTSMMERIREIGVLKAIGFSNRKILRLFLNEAIIIGIAGGTFGLALGVVLANILGRLFYSPSAYFEVHLIFTPESMLFTWGLCLFFSIVAGLYPAWRASQLDPVVALRHE